MGKVVILGSAYAIPDEKHANTHLMVIEGCKHILIDTASNPIQHIPKAGINVELISDIILTHFHPDHTSGIPLLLMDLWLMGRKNVLHIYGLKYTIQKIIGLMDLYEWQRWPGFYPVEFHELESKEGYLVIESPGLRIVSSPVCHLLPTIGLRIEFTEKNKVVAYSCDTEPCAQVERLALNADVLIHEASGASIGHSSPAQAAQVAKTANAKSLILIHYPSQNVPYSRILDEAKQVYMGPVAMAADFMELTY